MEKEEIIELIENNEIKIEQEDEISILEKLKKLQKLIKKESSLKEMCIKIFYFIIIYYSP